jgi:uncharacterized protein (DUF1697 family)
MLKAALQSMTMETDLAKSKSATAHYVGLLRGINVGGNKAVSMAALRELMEGLGFGDVKTLLQSGNVVFSGAKQAAEKLERQVEAAIRKKLAVDADVMIRTADEWVKIIGANPFQPMAESDPSHLVLICLKAKPDAGAVAKLQAAIKGREEVKAIGRELYVTYVDGIGTSKLTNTVIEKNLGARGTARNWNTALKIQGVLSQHT